MTKHVTLLIGVLTALSASTAITTVQAQDQTISFINCGDTLTVGYDKYIAEWEAKNPGWKIAPEVVGWGQCQDKVTTLAAAGTPVALAYVGSRTLKGFADSDLIIPITYTDAEKAAYYPHILDTVTYNGQQWGIPTAFSTKAIQRSRFFKLRTARNKTRTPARELIARAVTWSASSRPMAAAAIARTPTSIHVARSRHAATDTRRLFATRRRW